MQRMPLHHLCREGESIGAHSEVFLREVIALGLPVQEASLQMVSGCDADEERASMRPHRWYHDVARALVGGVLVGVVPIGGKACCGDRAHPSFVVTVDGM